jgi:[calcium/calmodulin-dependent protein kinase] kinase
MKKLRHVNIVSLVEVLDEADTDSLYMILELCKGGPIMQVTVTEDAEPMSEDVARGYFRQVLLGGCRPQLPFTWLIESMQPSSTFIT